MVRESDFNGYHLLKQLLGLQVFAGGFQVVSITKCIALLNKIFQQNKHLHLHTGKRIITKPQLPITSSYYKSVALLLLKSFTAGKI